MDEQWLPVEGWEEWLAVSTLGRVKAVERLATSCRESQPTQLRREIILQPHLNHAGYRTISTKRGGKRQKQFVHCLVAKAFVPGWFEGATVDHIDGNKLNNLPSNLEWVTRQENSRRQNAAGRGVPKGERHPCAKLADADVPKLFKLRAAGLSLSEIARCFNVSPSLVHKITSDLRRRDQGFPT
jgi:hypothetical protein